MKKLLLLTLSVFLLCSQSAWAKLAVIETVPIKAQKIADIFDEKGINYYKPLGEEIDRRLAKKMILVDYQNDQELAKIQEVVRDIKMTRLVKVSSLQLEIGCFDYEIWYWRYTFEEGKLHLAKTYKWIDLVDPLDGDFYELYSEHQRFVNDETRQKFLDDYGIIFKGPMRIRIILNVYDDVYPKLTFPWAYLDFEKVVNK